MAAVHDGALPLTTFGRFELLNVIRLSVFRQQLNLRVAAIDVLTIKAESGVLGVISCDWAAVHAEAERLSARHTAEGGHRSIDILHGDGALDGCKGVSKFRWKSNQTGERGRADSEALRAGKAKSRVRSPELSQDSGARSLEASELRRTLRRCDEDFDPTSNSVRSRYLFPAIVVFPLLSATLLNSDSCFSMRLFLGEPPLYQKSERTTHPCWSLQDCARQVGQFNRKHSSD
jgi:hypothetical protein